MCSYIAAGTLHDKYGLEATLLYSAIFRSRQPPDGPSRYPVILYHVQKSSIWVGRAGEALQMVMHALH
jgi:hypothetical protein